MEFQKRLLNTCENLLRKTGFKDETICRALRIVHALFKISGAYLVLFGSKEKVKLTIISIVIICLVLFTYFRGCLLSKLERRFCKDDYTTMDPLMRLFNISTTNTNRIKFTYGFTIVCFILASLVYYVRFIYKWENQQIVTI